MAEQLGLPENKAMKLFISVFFILLLLGFAGGSYGQTIAPSVMPNLSVLSPSQINALPGEMSQL